MKTLIIYDSVFGNTEQIALSIAGSLNSHPDVESFRVKDVKPEHLKDIGLLLVGSPTRGFRATPEINVFLSNIPSDGLVGIKVGAFDTRISLSSIKSSVFRFIVHKGGYAAKTIAKQLVKKGGNLILPPEGFIVSGEEGPLVIGEKERAAEWIKSILNGI
jgi:flavodoxin